MMSFTSSERKRKLQESEKMREKIIDLFEGKIFCVDCGRRMYFNRQKVNRNKNETKTVGVRGNYRCGSYVVRTAQNCKPRNMQQVHLEEKVLSAIQTQVKVALDYEKLLLKLKDSEGEKSIRNKKMHLYLV